MPRPPLVAVATCRAWPDLDDDGPMLRAALTEFGLRVEVRVWDEPGIDWSRYALVLVRSTWDYTLRRDQFLEWAQGCRLTSNPAVVLAWNTDKHYLQALERAGVPVVSTAFLEPGEQFTIPPAWRAGEIVVKPAVSANAADIGRFRPGAREAHELTVRLHEQGRAAMVQPYLKQVEVHGETALVYLGGRYSHAVRKAALLTSPGTRAPLVGDDAGDVVAPTTATPEQRAVAESALAAVPGGPAPLTYARVDLVPDAEGRPMLLELELTEPSLFLRYAAPGALPRFAAAVGAAAAAGR